MTDRHYRQKVVTYSYAEQCPLQCGESNNLTFLDWIGREEYERQKVRFYQG